jgi:MoaA/NifB/PqqE/SkfB family radical SAM enzyme
VVTPWNIDVLPQFIEKIRNAIDFIQVQPMHPYPPSKEIAVNNKQVSILCDYLIDLKYSDQGFLALPIDFIKGFEQFFKVNIEKICHAGQLYVAINPEGKLLACPARSDLVLGDILNGSIDEKLKRCNNEKWRKVSACRGCWLECTVGVSMVIDNPLKEAPQLISLWASQKK